MKIFGFLGFWYGDCFIFEVPRETDEGSFTAKCLVLPKSSFLLNREPDQGSSSGIWPNFELNLSSGLVQV